MIRLELVSVNIYDSVRSSVRSDAEIARSRTVKNFFMERFRFFSEVAEEDEEQLEYKSFQYS